MSGSRYEWHAVWSVLLHTGVKQLASLELRSASPARRACDSPRLAPRSDEQRLDKGIGVKGLEVVQGFADADELDREVHDLADGDDNAPLGGAVELGQDH